AVGAIQRGYKLSTVLFWEASNWIARLQFSGKRVFETLGRLVSALRPRSQTPPRNMDVATIAVNREASLASRAAWLRSSANLGSNFDKNSPSASPLPNH